MAVNAHGDFVIAWSSYGEDKSGYGVYAQQFDSLGNPVGQEIPVNQTTQGNQDLPSVAMDASGAFVVTWTGPNPTVRTDGTEIFLRAFDNGGNSTTAEMPVPPVTTGNQSNSDVAMDLAGDQFVVTWQSEGPQGPNGSSLRHLCPEVHAHARSDRCRHDRRDGGVPGRTRRPWATTCTPRWP